jgi:hypothetical protein
MHTMRYTNGVLTMLALMLGLNLWAMLHRSPTTGSLTNAAHAQSAPRNEREDKTDFAERRNQLMLDTATDIKVKLDTLTSRVGAVENLLRTGVNVNVVSMPQAAEK